MSDKKTKITCAYQGIEGSHSRLVLASYFSKHALGHEALGVSTFRQVAMTVISGKAEVGVIPIDNAIAGTVREGYDLLAQYDLVPVSEVEWKMDHRLLAPKGASLDGIREILAHPLVLEECDRFLGTLVGAKIIPFEDTGSAAQEVARSKDPTRAAIAPPEAAEIYGLVQLAENISDHPENYTRFMLFRSPTDTETGKALARSEGKATRRKTSVIFTTVHEHGALAKCLSILDEAGINLSKLESRPKLGKAWEYIFYMDFEGESRDPKIGQSLERFKQACASFHLIGSYEMHRDQDGASAEAFKEFEISAEPSTQTPLGWSPELLPSSAKNWPKASRAQKPAGTKVTVGDVTIGGDGFVVMAGPCSVESKEQVMKTAKAVRAAGAVLLRGGAFKPRTNPYAFQGMGWEGVALLGEAGRTTGMPVVSEVMSIDQVERMAREVDVLQIGARNMQNFDLLKAVGKTDRAILLKRGMSASLDELLAASEYILAEGNPNVMLCERGIRTFETATRNTLDLSAVPVLRERTHLPIIVDPSHGVGIRRWIRPLCRAAKAVGAHGIIVEVHPNPDEAKSDKDQALTFKDFEEIMADLKKIPVPHL